jgi:hypothetical protein
MASSAAADWPAFRGPQGLGLSDERGLPLKWTATANVAWKLELPGKGCSTPIVSGDRVFVTCFTGVQAAELRRHLLCVERTTGKLLWQKDVAATLPENDYTRHLLQHGFATSSPVTDGERVYVFYGRTGVLAYDFAGKELWRTEVGSYLNTFGSGASPIVYRDLLVVNASVESGALVALDRATGKQVWRTKFQDDCWTTPLLVETAEGRTELVLNVARGLMSFDPQKGQLLWQCDCPEPDYISASPVARKGIVYVMGAGHNGRSFMAVRAGGQGDITKTHVVWRQKIGASYCSPILVGEHLYFFSGQACCLRADDGQIVFQERLAELGTEYGSPVAADGKIYLFTRRGVAHVLAASGRFEPLAKNDLGDRTGFTASPAISHGQLFVRSNQYLYCLQEKGAK